jgi:murein DD-endopeptidase MepM/ murein hydrolase activator NlpD
MRGWKVWLGLLVLVVLGAGFVMWRQRQPLPVASLEPPVAAVGHGARTMTLVLRPLAGRLASVEARVVQGANTRTVLAEDLSGAGAGEARKPLNVEAKALGLTEGPAELQVFVTDSLWRPRPDLGPRLVHRFTVDLTPPTVELKTATGYIKHAGAGVVVYRVTGAARSGVQAGGEFFPGMAGLGPDPLVHVALYTVPYGSPATPPVILAEDEAGNQRLTGVPVTFLPVRFPKDTIRLSHAFLQRKVPELAPQTSGTASPAELVQAFLRVNRDGRKADEARNRQIGRSGGGGRPLWQGPFRQQNNTKVFANFPEERTYEVEGQVIDTEWHLGIDLASNRQSPIEASNAGKVIFAGPNGIYGNMVVLDHGLGLTSLYGHLSEIGVKTGQDVKQGEALGRSGETGLAGGDHLHFAMMVHGVYTTPLEWWDAHWLRDRLAKPLVEAGLALPGITDGALAPAAPAAAPAAPARSRPRRTR